MKRRHLLQAAAAAVVLPRLSFAQSFPNRPIRYIVPVAAGGGNDMIARVVTERWGALLGQPFVVDNQSGGGGVVASQLTARAVIWLATTPPPPLWLSTTKVWPSARPQRSLTTRAIMSLPPPAATGTM